MSESREPFEVERSLDLRGLDCPIPVLRTKLALRELSAGQIIHACATDPHSKVDFEAFCARTGHELVRQETRRGELHFYIRKKASARA